MIHSYRPGLLLGLIFLSACGSSSPPVDGAGGSAAGGTAPSGDAGSPSAAAGAAEGGSAAIAGSGNDAGGSPAVGGNGASGAGTAGSGVAGAAPAAGSGGSGTGYAGSSGVDPGPQGDGDVVAGPTYALQDDLRAKGSPAGRTFSLTMMSATSKFYTGLDTTLNTPRAFTRSVTVYVPAQYKPGTPAPVMVVQDGGGTTYNLAKVALDNLTISTDPARRLPAFVLVGVANGGGDSKGSQRGLEYDTMSDRYARFIDAEVLPAVVALPAIQTAYPGFTFTKDPEGRGTAGCSSGAAAAFTMAWFRPDLFRRVLAYSTTLVDQQDDDAAEEKMYPLGAWDYHSGLSLIVNSPEKKPVRMVINANEMDNGYNAAESGHHNWLMANERTAAAFKTKGYHYQYVLGKGLGHCDAKVQQATLADSLVWLWRGYTGGT